jgi:hypothetical protein
MMSGFGNQTKTTRLGLCASVAKPSGNHSTVTDFARLRGLSTSQSRSSVM